MMTGRHEKVKGLALVHIREVPGSSPSTPTTMTRLVMPELITLAFFIQNMVITVSILFFVLTT